jgi:hypothetical protein
VIAGYRLLTYPGLPQSHSGANLAAVFMEILVDFGIENKVRSNPAQIEE